MKLILVQVEEVVVAVAVFVRVNPLVCVGWGLITLVRPAITVGIRASKAVFR